MNAGGRREAWGLADEYEGYVGRWSRQVARRFVAWLQLPSGGRWLDVGCGTGALSSAVLELAEPAEVVGVDPSAGFVEGARATIGDPRATFRVASAEALPEELVDFEAVVSGLVLNFFADRELALSGMVRAVRPGGTVGAYVWDYAGSMELMRYFWDAAAQLDPAAAELDEGRRFSITRPDALTDFFSGRLADATVTDITIPTHFSSFDDYWRPFLGGQGPAPGYAMSLDEEGRTRLRELIRSRLPIAADGSIALVARAWAVRGTRRR